MRPKITCSQALLTLSVDTHTNTRHLDLGAPSKRPVLCHVCLLRREYKGEYPRPSCYIRDIDRLLGKLLKMKFNIHGESSLLL